MAWLPDDWDQLVRGRHRTTEAPDSARRRAGGQQPRRVSTIAAFTTGTLAVSTAAFAATVPNSPDPAPVTDPNNPHTSVVGASTLSAAFAASASGGTVTLDYRPGGGSAGLAGAIANPDPIFTNLQLTADKSSVTPNGTVMFTVRATEAVTGAPLANQQVKIVAVDGPKWQTTKVLTTDANGAAQVSANLLTTTTITAVFDGNAALRPSVAGSVTVTIQQPRPRGWDSSIPTVIPGSSIGEKAVYLASLQKGKPYVYGAAGPNSFDCSGLVQYVFKHLGRNLPRTAQAQYNYSTKVPQSAKQPGDLIFYGSENNITHVGIYAGNGYMWAAPQTGGVVSLRPIYSSTYKVGRIL